QVEAVLGPGGAQVQLGGVYLPPAAAADGDEIDGIGAAVDPLLVQCPAEPATIPRDECSVRLMGRKQAAGEGLLVGREHLFMSGQDLRTVRGQAALNAGA